MKLACAWMALLLSLAFEARAGSPMPIEMKCPVGGKKFTYISTASMSQWGSRPDGKPYGSWTFPMPLPECPDNGLVMYRDFTRDEVRKLKTLLAGGAYGQLRGVDTPYYRAYWLMNELGDAAENRAWVLQQAIWESDQDLARKQRYQAELVARVHDLAKPDAGQDDLGWIILQFRAANALRELGHFDEATSLLDSVPTGSLDVPVPEEKVSGTTKSGLGKFVENGDEIRAARNRRGWMTYPAQLRVVIARHDSSSEPIDMIPLRVAMNSCLTYPKSAPEYGKVCESDAMRAQMEKARKLRELMTQPANPPPAPATPEAAKPD